MLTQSEIPLPSDGFLLNIKIIGEAIYIKVSDRKQNPIATKHGNVPRQSCMQETVVRPSLKTK
jgi:hypothetical protein